MTDTEKSDKLRWPCCDYVEGGKLSESYERPHCFYLHYKSFPVAEAKVRCVKENFVECGPYEFAAWMKRHPFCPTIDEEKRLNGIANSAKIQAEAAKAVAQWSKISALVVFLWLIVAILNLIFPSGYFLKILNLAP